MIDCEDGLVNFMLHKLSESLYFTRKIGYYYIISKESIAHASADFKKRLKSNFLYFRYIIQSTKNNNIEKKYPIMFLLPFIIAIVILSLI